MIAKNGSRFIDRTGHKYGLLTVQFRVGTKKGRAVWQCLCACGKVVNVQGYDLEVGRTKSCGCARYRRDLGLSAEKVLAERRKNRTTETGNGRYRCSLHPSFLGVPPLTPAEYDVMLDPRTEDEMARCDEIIERMKRKIREAKGELPGFNKPEQPKGRLITANGVTRTIFEWAARAGVQPETIERRLSQGATPEMAVRPNQKRSEVYS